MTTITSGPLPPDLKGGVIALGNFDGFHLGHQAVVGRAVARARQAGRPALVGTFNPHPARFFRPETPPMALTTLDQRLDLLAAAGVDATVIWTFDAAFAATSAEDFVQNELTRRLGVTGVVTGGDYTFGRARTGDTALLARLGPTHGFTAQVVPPVTLDGAPVSSTRIRATLREGDPLTAQHLLTRPFTITGQVIHGDKRGRALGFPTANLRLGDYLRPAYGVYAVRARVGDTAYDGVANLGVRPMFSPPVELLETHLFDFAGDLYGRTIAVELHRFVRPEWRLESLEALTAQVEDDKARARELLAQ